MPKTCLIVGGGISGLTAALTLSSIGIPCIIHELRSSPSTIGGSINLTPNALTLLDSLNVNFSKYGCRVDEIEIFSLQTGKRLGELPCRKFGPSLRILREDLLRALLEAVEAKGMRVVYGKRLVGVREQERDGKVTGIFDDGKEVEARFILGCDGIHSAVRLKYVDPSRNAVYTSVAVAYSVIDATAAEGGDEIQTHFHQTSVNSSRFGTLLASYVNPDKSKIYLGATMETSEDNDKQGWRVRGADHERTLREVRRRYKDSAISCVNELVKKVEAFTFYPVYNLGPGGQWVRGRVLLLGDAAHGAS
jgi:salicylate hydroxylase